MKSILIWTLVLLPLLGCHKSSGNDKDESDAGDSEADTGTGTDADADTDSDADIDADTDTDTDTDSDADSDTDADTDTDTHTDTEPQTGEIGYRCDTAGECLLDLECLSGFFKERPVCTMACSPDQKCPEGIDCVEEIPDFDGNIIGPYCLRPCEQQEDCGTSLSSECDSHVLLEKKYCF